MLDIADIFNLRNIMQNAQGVVGRYFMERNYHEYECFNYSAFHMHSVFTFSVLYV